MTTVTTLSGNTTIIGKANSDTSDIIALGGVEIVSGVTTSALISGATRIYGSGITNTVYAGGSQTVESGGIASGTSVLLGGTELVLANGTTVQAVISGTDLWICD